MEKQDALGYEFLYDRSIALCPGMEPLITKIRCIAPLRPYECQQLIQQVRSGDKNAKKRLVEKYLRYALKFSLDAAEEHHMPLDELFSEAAVGLVENVEKYVTTSPVHFTARIIPSIMHSVSRYVHENQYCVPIPTSVHAKVEKVKAARKKYPSYLNKKTIDKICQKTGISKKTVLCLLPYTEPPISYEVFCEENKNRLFYDGESYLIRRIYNEQLGKVLREMLCLMSYWNETILTLRYNMDGQGGYTATQIAKMLNVNRDFVRAQECGGLQKLKRGSHCLHALHMFLELENI